jgi:hypothetical protein
MSLWWRSKLTGGLDFIAYIMENRVPKEKIEREKIVRRATNYIVIGTEL